MGSCRRRGRRGDGDGSGQEKSAGLSAAAVTVVACAIACAVVSLRPSAPSALRGPLARPSRVQAAGKHRKTWTRRRLLARPRLARHPPRALPGGFSQDDLQEEIDEMIKSPDSKRIETVYEENEGTSLGNKARKRDGVRGKVNFLINPIGNLG